MKAFFEKYPQEFNEMTAIKIIHKKVEQAQECLKKDKKGTEYLKYLAEAHEMIEDFFEEKGITPSTL